MLEKLKCDFARYPFRRSRFWALKLLFSSTGLSAVVVYRIQQFLFQRNRLLLSYFFHRINLSFHSIDIVPGAEIGAGLRIDHPVGIVIGSKVVIGQNCTILHGVTLGTRFLRSEKYDNQFPIVGDNVDIGCNSTILGKVEIGSRVNIGANSLILKNIPSDTTVTGVFS
jgi:serine O-acetyltransferase